MRARGFTLLETVMVIIIVGIIAAFVAPILLASVNSYDETSRNVEVLTRMRYAMERMAREIRGMRPDPASSLNYDIVSGSMTASKLEFCKADATRVTIDNATLSSEVKLGYTSGFSSTCTASAATTSTLTDAVTSFCISYCQKDGTTCTLTAGTCTASGSSVDRSNVAFVELRMQLTGTGTSAYTSTTRVDLRTPGPQ